MSAKDIIAQAVRDIFRTLDTPMIWTKKETGEEHGFFGDIADAQPDGKLGSVKTQISKSILSCMVEDIDGIAKGDEIFADGETWVVIALPEIDHSAGTADIQLRLK